MKIVFATGNSSKLHEASEILGEGFELLTPAQVQITEDIPETGHTIRANSLQKALYLHERTGMDCFADDTALEVDILGGEPGIRTARYAGESKEPGANMDKLLREMQRREYEASILRDYGLSTPHATRRARFRTDIVLILDGKRHVFEGVMAGRIARVRSGSGGFGYDPVFIADEAPDVTVAEISPAQKNAISHRGKALRAMAAFLREL